MTNLLNQFQKLPRRIFCKIMSQLFDKPLPPANPSEKKRIETFKKQLIKISKAKASIPSEKIWQKRVELFTELVFKDDVIIWEGLLLRDTKACAKKKYNHQKETVPTPAKH